MDLWQLLLGDGVVAVTIMTGYQADCQGGAFVGTHGDGYGSDADLYSYAVDHFHNTHYPTHLPQQTHTNITTSSYWKNKSFVRI